MIAKIIIILLITIGLVISISEHGKERKPTNGWRSFISYLLWMALFYWGNLSCLD